jgi:hypothetical protein
MQRLLVMQSMWAMEQRLGDRSGWPLERKVQAIAQAGFDGAGLRAEDRGFVAQAVGLLRDAGLAWQGVCIVRSHDELARAVALAAEFGAHHLDVQADLARADLAACAHFVEAGLRLGQAAGLPLYFETHRHRITADPRFTLALLGQVPGMQLTADLSHYVVGCEFGCPPGPEDEATVQALLQRSAAFHGRVGGREQIQLPLGFAHLQHWVDLFLRWWAEGFQAWCRRSAPDATLSFLCELGPPEYALTDRHGHELSDRWLEALELKDRVRLLWRRCRDELAADGAPPSGPAPTPTPDRSVTGAAAYPRSHCPQETP